MKRKLKTEYGNGNGNGGGGNLLFRREITGFTNHYYYVDISIPDKRDFLKTRGKIFLCPKPKLHRLIKVYDF